MTSILWALGRTLQFIALVQTGAALLIGMQTSNPTLELKLLLFGVLEFLLGWVLSSHFSKRSD